MKFSIFTKSSLQWITPVAVITTSISPLSSIYAQSGSVKTAKVEKENTEELAGEKNKEDEVDSSKALLSHDQASIRTRKDARTMTLSIPAPRGPITDRFGYPLVQNKVIWYPAIQMEQFEDESDEFIVNWCKKRIDIANELFDAGIKLNKKEIIEHYRHRRWLPMPFKHEVKKSQKDWMVENKKLIDGLILHPLYQRYYPEKSCAAHIIGYVGTKRSKLEKGPINYGDPLFWELEGRGGLEKFYNDALTGTAGKRKLQYDSLGREVRREDVAPRPGGTVVTTLDLEWQKRAERVLRNHCRRGAFVVIDVETGEVLVMASRPSYDLNLWVPYMKPSDYNELLNDKSKPLYARAFQGTYPPASAFKPVTGIAGLDTLAITKYKKLNCPAYIKLGNHKFWDWSKRSRGYLNILRATALSNNPFFIQVALLSEKKMVGRFMTVASSLGYGTRTGLPLDGEAKGNLLTEEYTLRKYSRGIKQGDIANAAIGQGAILASPLQVAQSMAAIANGGILKKISLIKQVQNDKGIIIMANKPQVKHHPKIDPEAVKIVKQGMFDVVNASHGTGKRGAISHAIVCAKTGTAQWGPQSKNQGLAWFAGYFPKKNPKYAFAVLYEGAPNEKVSGGRNAAPMVPAFFNSLKEETLARHRVSNKALILPDQLPEYVGSPLGDPNMKPGKALIVEDDENEIIPRALIVEDDEDETTDNPAVPVENGAPPLTPLPPGVPTEPTEPSDPVAPKPKSNKAIPVEDDEDEGPADLPELPSNPEPGPTPTPDPTQPTPPKAIPVE